MKRKAIVSESCNCSRPVDLDSLDLRTYVHGRSRSLANLPYPPALLSSRIPWVDQPCRMSNRKGAY